MRSPHVQRARAHRWLHEAHAQTRIAWALTERCQMRVWRCWSTRLQHSGPCRFWCCRGTLSQDSLRRVGWPWRVWYRRHTLLNHLCAWHDCPPILVEVFDRFFPQLGTEGTLGATLVLRESSANSLYSCQVRQSHSKPTELNKIKHSKLQGSPR